MNRGHGGSSPAPPHRDKSMRKTLTLLIFVLALSLALSRAESQSEGQEYLVSLKDGNSIDDVNKASGTQTVRQVPHSSIYLLRADTSSGDVLDKIKGSGKVDIAEPNVHAKLRSQAEAPLDPGLVQQAVSSLDGQTLTTFY